MNLANLRTDRLSLFQSARNPAAILARRRAERSWCSSPRRRARRWRESSSQRVPEEGRQHLLLVCASSQRPRSDPAVEMMDAVRALGTRGRTMFMYSLAGCC